MSLRDFPFDQQGVRVELVSTQNFATRDGTAGFAQEGQTPYKLHQVGGPTGTGLNLMTWSGEIVEWELHGIATEFVESGGNGFIGGVSTRLSLVFIVSRLTPYYFWKVLLPLYLVRKCNGWCNPFVCQCEKPDSRLPFHDDRTCDDVHLRNRLQLCLSQPFTTRPAI
jgi:hypothetical protein